MKTKATYIYKHTNIKNNKCYIGKTVQRVSRRARTSDKTYNSYKSCTKFYRALIKYGWSGFSTEILEIIPAERMHEVDDIEASYIEKFDSVNNGYNIKTKSTGLGVFPTELRKKLSESAKATYANGRIPKPGNKIHHEFIDGIEHKKCTKCNNFKTLSSFNKYRSTYDGLTRHCKQCIKDNYWKTKPVKEYKKMDYSSRLDAMSAGAKRAYENKPELREAISKRQSKPIQGTNIETGEIKVYSSGLAAKADGFDNCQISLAIKSGKPHRGYTWKKL